MGSALKKLLFLSVLLLSVKAYASPTTTISVPNSFTANTVIQSASVNSDFNEVSTKYNSHSHTDISQLGTITVGTWQGSAVGTQYGGTGKDWSGVTSGSIIYFNNTGAMTTLAQGATGQILQTGLNGFPPAWVTAGRLIQQTRTETGAMATGVTQLPRDDTAPQNTEGDQYMSLAITPTASASILRIDVTWMGANDAAGGGALTAALFQDTLPSALAASAQFTSGASRVQTINFTHFMSAGTTTSTTFKVRVGLDAAGTTTFNGVGGGRLYEGRAASSITITELAS